MNRRSFFKAIMTSGLILTGASFLTGCEDGQVKPLSAQEALTNHSVYIAALDKVKLSHKLGISLMEELNLSMKVSGSYSFDTEFTLPWYLGPKIGLDKNEYLLSKYSSSELLFSGYGIGDRLNMDYRGKTYGDIPISKKLASLGFKDMKEFYSFIFDKISSYSSTEAFVLIDLLDQKGILNTEEILNEKNIFMKSEELMKDLFKDYIGYEKSLLSTKEEIDSFTYDSVKENWSLIINDKVVIFSKEDFLIYALSYMICEEILLKAPMGVSINVH